MANSSPSPLCKGRAIQKESGKQIFDLEVGIQENLGEDSFPPSQGSRVNSATTICSSHVDCDAMRAFQVLVDCVPKLWLVTSRQV